MRLPSTSVRILLFDPNTIAVSLIIAWLSCLACVTWFALEHLKNALLPLALAKGADIYSIRFCLAAVTALTAVDIIFISSSILMSCVIIRTEQKFQVFSNVLIDGKYSLIVIGVALVFWFGHSYLGRGYLLSGDTIAHVAMIASRTRALLSGEDPAWSNMSYFGLPLLNYYSPTTFWPLSLIDWGLHDPSLSLRIFLFIAHLLSGLAIALLARQLGLSRIATFVAVTAYVGSFAHLHLLLFRGAIPQALSLVLLPLCLFFLCRVLNDARLSVGNWCGLVWAAAGLEANYAPLAILALVYIVPFGLAIWLARGAPLSRGLAIAAAAVMAAAVAAFALLPAALFHSVVAPIKPAEWVSFALPAWQYFDDLLVWRAWRSNEGGAAAYLGFTVVSLAAYALWRTVGPLIRRQYFGITDRKKALVTLGLGALLIASFFLRGAHVRNIVFTLLFISLVAGVGADLLLGSRRLGRSGPAILLGLILLDLGSTAMQSIGRSDKGYLDEAAAYLEHQVPQSRTMEAKVEGGVVTIGGAGIPSWHQVELVGAGHTEMASRAWIYGDIAETLAARDLTQTGRLSERTRALLCLLRVGRIIADDRSHMGFPATITSAESEGPLGRVVKTGCDYQVIFSTALAPATLSPIDARLRYGNDHDVQLLPAFLTFLDSFMTQLQLDSSSGTAAQIPVIGLQNYVTAPKVSSIATLWVKNYTVSTATVRIVLDVNTSGFVRLSHAASPMLHVFRGGSEVATYEDPMGFLVVPVTAGENQIEILPKILPTETLANKISIISVISLLFVALIPFGRVPRVLQLVKKKS